jgi:hypothetical protein
MKKNVSSIIITIVLLSVIFFTESAHSQQSQNQVGLVVQFGDGRIETDCVKFEEEKITGYQVFERSKFDVIPSFFSAEGWAICKIEENGCSADNCFCDPKLFWSYWSLMDGAWLYSVKGASNFYVYDGDVQGWRWSDGEAPEKVYSIDEICNQPTPTKKSSQQAVFVTNTPKPSQTPEPTNTSVVTKTSTSTVVPSPSLVPSMTATPTNTQDVFLPSDTATFTLQPTETEPSVTIQPSPEPTETTEPEQTETEQSEPTATLSGFQKSDQTAVALSEVSTMESMEVEEPSDVGKSLSKFAILTGGLIGYLFFIVLVVGLGIGLLILMLMRRK